ncbi:hypothetical protein [Streptomyces sp. NBC_01264]|uniref:hypothetical protein n=1 Tax=Streptomyces sp. NBC_01264 TaxID=2903804 RepID=UPI0022546910|nr:hypothetical protein [Streptomyces sp. NBC_01264]MCX4784440.1 hypothetical protein [Streptomyces sp. NBC_01264]
MRRYTRTVLTAATTACLALTTLGPTAHADDHNDSSKNNNCFIKVKGNHNNSACNDITFGNNATTGNGHSVRTGLGTVLPPTDTVPSVTLPIKQPGYLVGNWDTATPFIPVPGTNVIPVGALVQLNCVAGYKPSQRHMFLAQYPGGNGPATTGYLAEISFEENQAAPPTTEVINALNTLPICPTAIPTPPFTLTQVFSQTSQSQTLDVTNPGASCPDDHPYIDRTFPSPTPPLFSPTTPTAGVKIVATSNDNFDLLELETNSQRVIKLTTQAIPPYTVTMSLWCTNTPPST